MALITDQYQLVAQHVNFVQNKPNFGQGWNNQYSGNQWNNQQGRNTWQNQRNWNEQEGNSNWNRQEQFRGVQR